MTADELLTIVHPDRCEKAGSCGGGGGGSGACAGCSAAQSIAESSTPQGDQNVHLHQSVDAVKTCEQDRCAENAALLPAPEHVLSTLDRDGGRRWIRPRLSTGRFWKFRRIVASVLMVVFIVIPHLQVSGKPLILLDLAARQFTILGWTFLPTDTLLLALLMVGVFLAIALVTAVTGRAWCGWACPQTVYMEFLFRPIDRLFEGTAGKGGKPKRDPNSWRGFARLITYCLLSMLLAHTFLAYFVGVERLSRWVQSSPFEHPQAFLVMAGTTIAMLFDFLFFREQMCTLACPYGRLQSVMLDPHSLIVGFDFNRGEPRKKGKRSPDTLDAGDCIDCRKCVSVCPTGIDIRDGLQMECINCTQCMDACDDVMQRMGKSPGLIRYTSQNALSGKPSKPIRARTIIYPLALLGILVAFGLTIADKAGFDARVIRGKGAPYWLDQDNQVTNAFSIRLVNRTQTAQQYTFALEAADLSLEVVDEADLQLPAGGTALVPILVHFDADVTGRDGNEPTKLTIVDGDDRKKDLPFRVLGPKQ